MMSFGRATERALEREIPATPAALAALGAVGMSDSHTLYKYVEGCLAIGEQEAATTALAAADERDLSPSLRASLRARRALLGEDEARGQVLANLAAEHAELVGPRAMLALHLIATGSVDDGEQAAHRLVEDFPESSRGHVLLALAAADRGAYPQALGEFTQAASAEGVVGLNAQRVRIGVGVRMRDPRAVRAGYAAVRRLRGKQPSRLWTECLVHCQSLRTLGVFSAWAAGWSGLPYLVVPALVPLALYLVPFFEVSLNKRQTLLRAAGVAAFALILAYGGSLMALR